MISAAFLRGTMLFRTIRLMRLFRFSWSLLRTAILRFARMSLRMFIGGLILTIGIMMGWLMRSIIRRRVMTEISLVFRRPCLKERLSQRTAGLIFVLRELQI